MKKQTEPKLIAVDEADATTEGEVAEQLAWVVDVASHGDRLDRYLVTQVSSVSRSYLSQLITQSAVHLNGVLCVKPAHKVKAGDAVSLS
ncbi:MAG: S4 domain-containing protein [Burkholderiaceae bacterium]|nr:S4 domain-containing protein [Burkholderiaceae bacterium]